jgi:hypothetical protein
MSPTALRFDVAIYMPLAAAHYRRSGPVGGGAELQTVLLARALAARGVRDAANGVGHRPRESAKRAPRRGVKVSGSRDEQPKPDIRHFRFANERLGRPTDPASRSSDRKPTVSSEAINRLLSHLVASPRDRS